MFVFHVDLGDIAVTLVFRSWYFKILTCGRFFCFSLHLAFCPCAGGKVRILGGETFVECICFIHFIFLYFKASLNLRLMQGSYALWNFFFREMRNPAVVTFNWIFFFSYLLKKCALFGWKIITPNGGKLSHLENQS